MNTLDSATGEARTCPSCHIPLAPQRHGAIEVDVCARCCGAFFDPGESELAFGPGADPEVWATTAGRPPQPAAPCCPQGHGPMWSIPTGSESVPTWVHVCARCRGAWLDAAAIETVRRGYAPLPPVEESSAHRVGRYLFLLVSAMPIEVSNPVKITPWLTWSLAASTIATFVALRAMSPASSREWVEMLAVVPTELRAGFGLLTPLSYAWIHSGVVHLLGNLYFFVVFGDNIEDRFGRLWYALLLATATVFGALTEVVARGDSAVAVGGASGAVAGVLGAYMVLFPRTKLRVVFAFIPWKIPAAAYFTLWLAIQVWGYLTHRPGIAWMAHIGGFAAGAAAAGVARLESKAVAA